jgi:ABC-type uncharacterized transport system substrate-binding protein
MPLIGWLGTTSPGPYASFVAAFRQGLSETSYVEGQNLAIEYRWAEGSYDRLPALVADLVGRKVDVIVTSGGPSSGLAAKRATSTIPVVFISSDPVEFGLVISFARPGGNLTGVSTMFAELTPLRIFPAAGGLISYGSSLTASYRQLGIYAGKILKGAKPDLPVQQPTTFELVINLKTAKALGLTVPQSLLQRADEVIE